MTKDEALSRVMKMCSVKEYAPSEIEQKLSEWGIEHVHIEEILNTLIEDKFLDEARMARYFANDKLRFNKWGKVKIKFMLRQKKLNNESITEALAQINDLEYNTILLNELAKKRKAIKDTDDYTIRAKLMQFAIGRGFETDLIYKAIDKLKKD